jgi:hypothetical protein
MCGPPAQIVELAQQKDSKGNLVHAELASAIATLQNDSRTFVLQSVNDKQSNEAGKFTITQFTNDGRDFTRATIALSFEKVKDGAGVTPADYGLNFMKFGGLADNIRRFAELVGHEFEHGVFAIKNPAHEVETQRIVNDALSALAARPKKGPIPPDVQEKLDRAQKATDPTERFAQEKEKIINGELTASQPKRH